MSQYRTAAKKPYVTPELKRMGCLDRTAFSLVVLRLTELTGRLRSIEKKLLMEDMAAEEIGRLVKTGGMERAAVQTGLCYFAIKSILDRDWRKILKG